jgi:hypothetical protein
VNVAHDFSGDDQFAGMNVRIEMSGGADRQFVALQRNGAVDLAVNLQGFGAGELTLISMLAPMRAELPALVPPRREFEPELNGTPGAAEPREGETGGGSATVYCLDHIVPPLSESQE